MKKSMIAMLMLFVLVAAGCGNNTNNAQNAAEATEAPAATAASTEPVKIKVATLIPPMTDILDIVKPLLLEDGVDMEIVVLSDNVQPNEALANKEVDANFFQHVPYMKQFNESKGSNLVPVQPVYDAIYGGYSKKVKSIEELPEGATLVMANDPSNIGRSLQMFADAGLIKLKDGVGITATQADITENPKNFKIEEVDLLMLARMLDDGDLVAMTPAYASPLGLTPKKDALITEREDSEFTITMVAREDNQDSDAIQKLAKRISGPEVKKFLEDNYADIALPAFE
ncbi:ABC transporter substrate-binding protein [Paenibacillus sp. FSL R7-0273]|uniref:MetQ/NlpA family ABC transporter substrate-binding protein n=1 Tax=Paenibacillus sp. FSL R7-0273 TaxID=1536772 RepID=UPI0004F914D4|nr:MetQ/NlpA family ABC transporter substrate-binding protein [Paenibacillus sp. FSL R7-0273]AIQ49317.1 ABC transporter substrate-binding protein [Paenibacillus sp. FSL R7-0273]OMF88009.1 ABC transporter substrate-binding protein [Paenibacillus sp. FSL R7-0273]